MSSLFSVQYVAALLPATVALYALCPRRFRPIVLLLASYAFFWAVSGKLLIFLLCSTVSIHLMGLWLQNRQSACDRALAGAEKAERKAVKARFRRQQRWLLLFALAQHFGTLLVLKYSAFFLGNLDAVFQFMQLPVTLEIPSFVLPIGISFYTMQAASYLLDVYWQKIPADTNPLRLALFLGFFPQIVEGPICRYSETAAQLWAAPPLRYQNLLFGLQRIIYGFMKKVVVADRLNIFVKSVFSDYQSYDGLMIAAAAVCYTIQLYMDFSGAMDVALGSGQIFGVKLTENFQRPFFSKSISEFWKRWHITLGTWFRDYIFYPVSLSAPMKRMSAKARKKVGNHFGPLTASAVALFCVWICNGLWHGAGWNFIFFGMYHFALILGGNIVDPFAEKLATKLHFQRTDRFYRYFCIVRTALLVCIGEMFFRAASLSDGLGMLGRIFTDFSLETVYNHTFFNFGMDLHDYLIVGAVLLVIFIIGVLQERGVSIRARIGAKPLPVRYAVYYALILSIVIFGAYGSGYVPVDPIYASF